ncbi:MAG: hypothetical protein LBS94_03915 [Prevotellaceae bacterium]|jgi:hypothetical protein|nr:hypothetical protein [Prevotellaceae bacterium]
MLSVPFLPLLNADALGDEAMRSLACLPSHSIACVSWKAFSYAPQAEVKIAQTEACLLLQYAVREACIRAKFTQPNEAVWTDSCVEFFVSFDDKKTYYNLETNCIGTPLMRYNIRPHEGPMATPQQLSRIRTRSTLGAQPIAAQSGDFAWTLTLAIPYDCFFAHSFASLRGQNVFANFYKCGDELVQPHYLSMFPINTPAPNFHVPEFFQQLKMA